MNWINGRPDDWTKETDNDCPFFSDSTGDPIVCSQRPNDFESGASAMLAALLKWLFEKCANHPKTITSGFDDNEWEVYPEHRYLCPQCMAELKESGK